MDFAEDTLEFEVVGVEPGVEKGRKGILDQR